MTRSDAWRARFVFVSIALAPVLAAPAHVTAENVPSSHVLNALRCDDRYLNAAIARGLARSAALRELVDHLYRAPVIVYVRFNDAMVRGTLGRTRLAAVAHGWRYVSIELTPRLTQRDLVVMFGHELQHAVEIADALEVVDEASLAAFYRRVGTVLSIRDPAFETNAAIAAERRVSLELEKAGW